MGCLYCGKPISPIRKLRDADFCSSPHRRQHGERLSKVLTRLGEPEPAPCGMAPFVLRLPLSGAAARRGEIAGRLCGKAGLVRPYWRVGATPLLGESFALLPAAAAHGTLTSRGSAWIEPPVAVARPLSAAPAIPPALVRAPVFLSRGMAPVPSPAAPDEPVRVAPVSGAAPAREPIAHFLPPAPGSREFRLAAPLIGRLRPVAEPPARFRRAVAWSVPRRNLAASALRRQVPPALGAGAALMALPEPARAAVSACAPRPSWQAAARRAECGAACTLRTAVLDAPGPQLTIPPLPVRSAGTAAFEHWTAFPTRTAALPERAPTLAGAWLPGAARDAEPRPADLLPLHIQAAGRVAPVCAGLATRQAGPAPLDAPAIPQAAGARPAPAAAGPLVRFQGIPAGHAQPAMHLLRPAVPEPLRRGALPVSQPPRPEVPGLLPLALALCPAAANPMLAGALPLEPHAPEWQTSAIPALSWGLGSPESPGPLLRMGGVQPDAARRPLPPFHWETAAAGLALPDFIRSGRPAPPLASEFAAFAFPAGLPRSAKPSGPALGTAAPPEPRLIAGPAAAPRVARPAPVSPGPVLAMPAALPEPMPAACRPQPVEAGPAAMPEAECAMALSGAAGAGFAPLLPAPADVFSRPSAPVSPLEAGPALCLPALASPTLPGAAPESAGLASDLRYASAPLARFAPARFAWAASPVAAAMPDYAGVGAGGGAWPAMPAPAPAGNASVPAPLPAAPPLAAAGTVAGPMSTVSPGLPRITAGPAAGMAAADTEPWLELTCHERRCSPSWHFRWWPAHAVIRLAHFELAAAPVSLAHLLAHSRRAEAPVPITRVAAVAHWKSPTERRFRVPRDLQAIAAAMVLGAFLWAWWSTAHNPGSSRPAITAQNDRQGRRGGEGAMAWLRQAIATRAAVEIGDRFSSGMDVWDAAEHASAEWIYSPAAYSRKSRLALYRPSLELTDYRLEFLTQIDKRSAGWVVRARNLQNYYAIDLRVVKAGPRPMLSLIRYSVLEGRAGRRVEVPVPFRLQNSVPYRVAMEVKGRRFAASIDGQEIDSWSDDALPSGGVGFFNEAGAHAKVYWVRVTNNDDLLGRICGRIAAAMSGEPGTQASLGRATIWAGPLWGPEFFFATASYMETPGREGSMTYGLFGKGDRRGGRIGPRPTAGRRRETG